MPNFKSTDLHIPHKEWGDDIRERENYSAIERWARSLSLSGLACQTATSSASQSVPNATNTQATLDTAEFQNGSDVTISGGIFTVHTTGLYLLAGQAVWTSSAASFEVDLSILASPGITNSPTDKRDAHVAASGGGGTVNSFSLPRPITAGTSVKFMLFQTSGGAYSCTNCTGTIVRLA